MSRWRAAIAAVGVLLAAAGAAQDTPDASEQLAAAIDAGDLARVRKLVALGADVNVADKAPGIPPLVRAIGAGQRAIAEVLLEAGADVNLAGFLDAAPLWTAALMGFTELAALLIERGAEVNRPSDRDITPLHCAAKRGHLDMVERLLKHGADTTAEDDRGLTPLEEAAQAGFTDVVELLERRGAEVTLEAAAACGDVERATGLLDAGADVNERGTTGATPLHRAAAGDHVEVAQVLLQRGADVSLSDRRGRTPLHTAAGAGSRDVARLLLEHGADPNLPDAGGLCPLHMAAEQDDRAIAALLLNHGAETEAVSEVGTPLHHAVKHGRTGDTGLLLEHGANVDALDSEGNTALHLIADSLGGRPAVARLLLAYNADPDLTNMNGATALHLALNTWHPRIALHLVQYGADVEARDARGRRAIDRLRQDSELRAQLAGGPEAAGRALMDPRRPEIRKLGTIDCDMVETTPIVFGGRLYRFEYVRANYHANSTGDSYFRFIDVTTGEATPSFAEGYHLGCAHVEGDTVYVYGVNMWGTERIQVFWSKDLKTWQEQPALVLQGWGIYNTSVCRGADRYVMAIELGEPPEVVGSRFTMRFAESDDLLNWRLTSEEQVYTKERYSACPALRFLDGFYYMIYLEARPGPTYEPHIVRSTDLVNWEASPLSPVMEFSPEDKRIANEALTEEQRERIASAVNINNSDVDLCEFGGRVIIYYSWGNQHGIEHLAEGAYEGTLESLLKGFFEG